MGRPAIAMVRETYAYYNLIINDQKRKLNLYIITFLAQLYQNQLHLHNQLPRLPCAQILGYTN
jgi:hypothetical protein